MIWLDAGRCQMHNPPTMLAPLLLLAVAVLAWKFAAPGNRFLSGFARLLTTPAVVGGPLSVLSGRSEVTGSHRGREVIATLQLKRGTHGIGSLVVAMRTASQDTLDGSGIDGRVRDEAGRLALFTLAAEEVVLSLDQRWLQALWRPARFAFFPGPFDEARWLRVLDSLGVVVVSLER